MQLTSVLEIHNNLQKVRRNLIEYISHIKTGLNCIIIDY